MTKKEILTEWLNEPRARYCSKSNIVHGYGDGWDWVKGTLRPTLTKNAMFTKALEFAMSQVRSFIKEKSDEKNLRQEDRTLYGFGYRDGVSDALASVDGRLRKCN